MEEKLGFSDLLTEDEIQQLNRTREVRRIKRKSVIYQEGFSASDVIVISEGLVKLTKNDNFLRDSIVKIAGEKDILGLEAFVTDHRYAATATAISDCTIHILPKDTFKNIVLSNKKFCEYITYIFLKYLDEAYKKIGDVVYKPAIVRIAETILKLSGNEDNVTIMREDVAYYVGTTRETVARVFGELKRDHLIATKAKKIIILNRKGLEKIAQTY